MLTLCNHRRNVESDRRFSRFNNRGVEFRLSRGFSRLNEHGLRKGVARCIVPSCQCSGRANYLLRNDV